MNPIKRINALAALAAVPSMVVIDQTGVGVDGDTVTINGVIFELDDDATYTSTNVQVDISAAATAAATMTALAAAINASNLNALGYSAGAETNNSIEQCVVVAPRPFTASETLTNGTAVTKTGTPEPYDDQYATIIQSRVPSAGEVTTGVLHFVFPGTVVNAVLSTRVTSTGVVKTLTDALSISGQRAKVTAAGATNFAATDTVSVIATIKKVF